MAGLLPPKEEAPKEFSFSKNPAPLGQDTSGTPEEQEQRKRKQEADRLLTRKKQTRVLRGQEPPAPVTKEQATGPSTFNFSGPSNIDPNKLGGGRFNLKAFPPRNPEIDGVGSSIRPPKEEGWGIKTYDFLFGSEGAAIGIAHDATGFSWNVENMKQQWSEQPLWVNALAMTSLVGSIVWPASIALRASAKVGKVAELAGKFGGEAAEIARWKELGRVGDDVKKYADLGEGYEDTVKIFRRQEIALTKYTKMAKRAEAVERGDLTWSSPVEKGLHEFEKRFSNHYYDAISSLGSQGQRKVYNETLDSLWASDTVGSLLRNLPDEAAGTKITAHLLERQFPELSGRAATEFGALSKEEGVFVDFYEQAARQRQKLMFDDGVISVEEFNQMGGFHLPALFKGTPDAGIGTTRDYLLPVVKGKGLKTKPGALIEETVPRTGLGKLFGKEKTILKPGEPVEYMQATINTAPRLDAPTLLARKGTPEQIWQRLKEDKLITSPHLMTANGYLTDSVLHTNYKFIRDLATNNDFIASADDIAAWGGDATKAAKAGFIRLDYAGSDAATRLARMISKKTGEDIKALPYIRKDIFKEIFGENGMMEQAKMVGSDAMAAATTMYKTMKTAMNLPTHFQNLTGNMVFLSQAGFNVTNPKNIALMGEMTTAFNKIAEVHRAAKEAKMSGSLFGGDVPLLKNVDLGHIKVGDRSFDLTKEMFHPAVKHMIEESSFDSVEGAGSLTKIYEQLGKEQHMTKLGIDLYQWGKKKLQFDNKFKWIDGATKAYLAEDMIPKMSYYMHLRGKGFTEVAAATEVARRLPMYGTVGSSIRLGRKFLFPWATFPTEALRITKNNIQDYPLRMIPWLRAPQIMQSMVSGLGLGPETAEAVAESKAQLPFWAQKTTGIMMTGTAAAGVGGGTTGGLVGGITGAVLGKSGGAAAAGAAVGAGIGGLVAALTTSEQHGEEIRAAMMDFLPHSTFMLANTSEDFGGDIVPWKDTKGFLEQMPAEPLAILKPLIQIWSGEDAYGNPIQGNGLSKGIAGMIGFMAPPLIQKYGFKLTTPQVSFPGDPTGITNISRGLIDVGADIDPMTGFPGSFSHDFLLNNFGTWKSYAATGERQLVNEQLTEKHMSEVRNYLTKNLAFHLENGNDKESVEILSEVQATFSNEHADNPRMATKKYTEWLERQYKTIGKHPMLRSWTQEEIVNRIRQVGAASGDVRSQARETMLKTLRDEYRMGQAASTQKTGLFKSKLNTSNPLAKRGGG